MIAKLITDVRRSIILAICDLPSELHLEIVMQANLDVFYDQFYRYFFIIDARMLFESKILT